MDFLHLLMQIVINCSVTGKNESASLRWRLLPQRPGSAGCVDIHQGVHLFPHISPCA